MAKFSVTISTAGLEKRMQRSRQSVQTNLTKAINNGAALVHETAVDSVSKQGAGNLYQRIIENGIVRVYMVTPPFNKLVAVYKASTTGLSEFHRASAAGDPPATDTGRLVGSMSIDYAENSKNPIARVRATAPHAIYLEHGTKTMAKRPFMRPALEANRKEVMQIARQAIKQAIKDERGKK